MAPGVRRDLHSRSVLPDQPPPKGYGGPSERFARRRKAEATVSEESSDPRRKPLYSRSIFGTFTGDMIRSATPARVAVTKAAVTRENLSDPRVSQPTQQRRFWSHA